MTDGEVLRGLESLTSDELQAEMDRLLVRQRLLRALLTARVRVERDEAKYQELVAEGGG